MGVFKESRVTPRGNPRQRGAGLGPVSTLSSLVAISAGADFGLALSTDGSVWAWGNHNSGQLGDSTTTASVRARLRRQPHAFQEPLEAGMAAHRVKGRLHL